MRIAGLDFGTTNSALAVVSQDGQTQLAQFLSAQGQHPSFRSALYFDRDILDERLRPIPITGPQAVDFYLDGDGEGRFIQSIKTYLVSKVFRQTSVWGQSYKLETLISTLLADLRAEAQAQLGSLGDRVVVGRPVHLSPRQDPEEDNFAIQRLRKAVLAAGFEDVVFEFEPVAAAYHYERRLSRDELVLIADFGGGTSDFTLVRVGPDARRSGTTHDRVLGSSGVPVAGNAFDNRVVRKIVAPALGMGSRYKSAFGKVLTIPASLYNDLEWHRLSMLHAGDVMEALEDIHKTAFQPEKIEAFMHIVNYNMGYNLYRSVEHMKVALSKSDVAEFVFEDEDVSIRRTVHQDDFESWIRPELEAIEGAVDQILNETGVAPSEVDCVFMTGGSSFVRGVRRIFESRFGADKLRGGDELTSVAQGLALRAMDLHQEGH